MDGEFGAPHRSGGFTAKSEGRNLLPSEPGEPRAGLRAARARDSISSDASLLHPGEARNPYPNMAANRAASFPPEYAALFA